ncbi:MAG: SpoIID/LytB domain-containing protein [Candidatus Krumholzibacteria bacterium]|nr:SpoIID/LytB domain-containing protein [Candidatus Krumholzibacteria bacterium]
MPMRRRPPDRLLGGACRSRRHACAACALLAGLLAACGAPRPACPPAPAPAPLPPAPEPGEAPIVRVLVLESDRAFTVSVPRARVFEAAGDGWTPVFEISGTFAVSRAGDGVRLRQRGGRSHDALALEIRPDAGGLFTIEDIPYRGILQARPGGSGIAAINVIEIDDYLKGVLPSEIGHLGDGLFEAYRAQAIASRSYALSKLEEKRGELFDLRSTVMDQVYRGVRGENARASEAVDATRGLVGTWDGEPIRAYYSSCCGGHTADIRVGWPWKTPYPYLEGVRDAPPGENRSYCAGSGHFRWEAKWSGTDLARILQKTLRSELGEVVRPFNILRDIRIDSRSASGRAAAITVVTDAGTWRVEGDRIRWVLRPDSPTGPILRSTLFKMETRRGGGRVRSVELIGGGNGHGIGMCQNGSIRMAGLGMSAEQILGHYYPGIAIGKIYR